MAANGASRVPSGPWRSGWRRLRRDRGGFLALVAAAAVVLVALFGSAVCSRLVGHDGNKPFLYATSADHRPVGPWTHVPTPRIPPFDAYGNLLTPPKGTSSTLFIFGADGPLGRDELIRLLDGLRTSLEIGIGAMLVALVIALPVGAVAGYFGGVADAIVSQLTETVMAFPLLLFLLFANRYLIGDIRSLGWSWVVPPGAIGEGVLIGIFTAFYPLRLIRVQLFALRNAEFVEAAHMVGASNWRILRRHLVPHLAPTLLVWAGIAVGTNILAEVGLSFLGVGVQPSTPTLGTLLSGVWGTIFNPQTYNRQAYTPWQTIFPMVTIVVTVMSLNRLSEALRRALEPRAVR
jgi:ABC-type dipeptide/oligopeptide/nickel transport system permease subunit